MCRGIFLSVWSKKVIPTIKQQAAYYSVWNGKNKSKRSEKHFIDWCFFFISLILMKMSVIRLAQSERKTTQFQSNEIVNQAKRRFITFKLCANVLFCWCYCHCCRCHSLLHQAIAIPRIKQTEKNKRQNSCLQQLYAYIVTLIWFWFWFSSINFESFPFCVLAYAI